MNIDWYKYTLQILPPGLRNRRLFEFARTLIWQLPTVNSELTAWFNDARFRASMNASVMCLQKLLERYLGVKAAITELDGKPADFLVSIQGTVDEARVKAIIDRYKLAGKTYVFQSSSIAHTLVFTDWVCEEYTEVITVIFVDYVCEDDRIVPVSVQISGVTESYASIFAFCQVPVHSNLSISGTIYGINPNNENFIAGYFNIHIAQGRNSGNTDAFITAIAGSTYFIDGAEIDPQWDAMYIYELNF